MPYFICPRCTWRGTQLSRTEGFSSRPVGCARCGFGFLFELLDDYYPSPRAGIVVCDQQGRVLAFGSGLGDLTGFDEPEVIGMAVEEALELRNDGGDDDTPVATVREWGVRKLELPMTTRHADGHITKVTADIFPAYDHDGGLLVVLTPRSS